MGKGREPLHSTLMLRMEHDDDDTSGKFSSNKKYKGSRKISEKMARDNSWTKRAVGLMINLKKK